MRYISYYDLNDFFLLQKQYNIVIAQLEADMVKHHLSDSDNENTESEYTKEEILPNPERIVPASPQHIPFYPSILIH